MATSSTPYAPVLTPSLGALKVLNPAKAKCRRCIIASSTFLIRSPVPLRGPQHALMRLVSSLCRVFAPRVALVRIRTVSCSVQRWASCCGHRALCSSQAWRGFTTDHNMADQPASSVPDDSAAATTPAATPSDHAPDTPATTTDAPQAVGGGVAAGHDAAGHKLTKAQKREIRHQKRVEVRRSKRREKRAAASARRREKRKREDEALIAEIGKEAFIARKVQARLDSEAKAVRHASDICVAGLP